LTTGVGSGDNDPVALGSQPTRLTPEPRGGRSGRTLSWASGPAALPKYGAQRLSIRLPSPVFWDSGAKSGRAVALDANLLEIEREGGACAL
jgi:hypothetical protein